MKTLKTIFKFAKNLVTLEFAFEENDKVLQNMIDFRECLKDAVDTLTREIEERESKM